MATGKIATTDEPRVLFTIEQRVVIGAVIDDPYGSRHPVATAMDIIGNRMVESAGDGLDCSFEFTFDGVKRTIALTHETL